MPIGGITTLQYAMMANRVYSIGKDAAGGGSYSVEDFETMLFDEGMNWGATNTDFKGCVYVSKSLKEVVVAFQGTVPAKGGDLLADLQIGIGSLVGMLPQSRVQLCGCSNELKRLNLSIQSRWSDILWAEVWLS